jgi:hypothetical protein
MLQLEQLSAVAVWCQTIDADNHATACSSQMFVLLCDVFGSLQNDGHVLSQQQIATHQLLRKVLSIWVLNHITDWLWN